MKRLIAVFAGVGLAVASTHPLSAGVASAPATKNTEQSGGSLMRQPLIMLARDYHSVASGLARAAKSPLVRPNAAIRSLGPASRVRGTAARGSFSPAWRVHGTTARGASRAASRGRGIGQRGPSLLPSANQGAPGSPGSPGSLGPGTGQSAIGAGQIGSRVPGESDRFPNGELNAGQNVIEYLNRKDGNETPQNPIPQLFSPAASRHSCKINCIDVVWPGWEMVECRAKKESANSKVVLCEYLCDGKKAATSPVDIWLICIDLDDCPKRELKVKEVGPLGQPSVCSWYDKYNSNDRRMFDKIRCPQGTTWHDRDKDDPNKSLEQAYATLQEAGVELPLLTDFELGSCWPDIQYQ